MSSENLFIGFVAYYEGGRRVKEREHFYSKVLKKQCATNWAEVALTQVVSLEIVWKGVSKIKISKADNPHIKPDDWYFSHSAYMDMASSVPKTLTRNIGYRKGKILYLYAVNEETGDLQVSTRLEH